MSTLASDSSLDSADLDSRRSCPNCNCRMSNLNCDRHNICVTCPDVIFVLLVLSKIVILKISVLRCSLWSDDIFERYLKHRKSLIAKSKCKKSRKDTLGKPPCKSSISQVQGDLSITDDSIPLSMSISEDRVKTLIAESFAYFRVLFPLLCKSRLCGLMI